MLIREEVRLVIPVKGLEAVIPPEIICMPVVAVLALKGVVLGQHLVKEVLFTAIPSYFHCSAALEVVVEISIIVQKEAEAVVAQYLLPLLISFN